MRWACLFVALLLAVAAWRPAAARLRVGFLPPIDGARPSDDSSREADSGEGSEESSDVTPSSSSVPRGEKVRAGLEVEVGLPIAYACRDSSLSTCKPVAYDDDIMQTSSGVEIDVNGIKIPLLKVVIDHEERAPPAGEPEVVTGPIPIDDTAKWSDAQFAITRFIKALKAPVEGRRGGGLVPLADLIDTYHRGTGTGSSTSVASAFRLSPAPRSDGLEWFVKLPVTRDINPTPQINYGIAVDRFASPGSVDMLEAFCDKGKRDLFESCRKIASKIVGDHFSAVPDGDLPPFLGTWVAFLYNLAHELRDTFKPGASGEGHGKDALDQLIKCSPNDLVRLIPGAHAALLSVVGTASTLKTLAGDVSDALLSLSVNSDLRNKPKIPAKVLTLVKQWITSVFAPSAKNRQRYPRESDTAFGTSIDATQRLTWRDGFMGYAGKMLAPYKIAVGSSDYIGCVVESRHTHSALNQLFAPGTSSPNVYEYQIGLEFIKRLSKPPSRSRLSSTRAGAAADKAKPAEAPFCMNLSRPVIEKFLRQRDRRASEKDKQQQKQKDKDEGGKEGQLPPLRQGSLPRLPRSGSSSSLRSSSMGRH